MCYIRPRPTRKYAWQLCTGCFALQVLVDGCDVRDMDVHWLRSQVGLVSQEPVLFSCTVKENICYGNPDATQQQVEDAARAANAHSFIQKLPEGYSTQVRLAHDMGACCYRVADCPA